LNSGINKIYPVPSNGLITIEPGSSSIDKVQVINLAGEMVASYDIIPGKPISLDLAEQGSGVYLLHFMSDGLTAGSSKVVVK
jgi:hypothetical protein